MFRRAFSQFLQKFNNATLLHNFTCDHFSSNALQTFHKTQIIIADRYGLNCVSRSVHTTLPRNPLVPNITPQSAGSTVSGLLFHTSYLTILLWRVTSCFFLFCTRDGCDISLCLAFICLVGGQEEWGTNMKKGHQTRLCRECRGTPNLCTSLLYGLPGRKIAK